MDETTTRSLELLARRMNQRTPVLFTGAGFSFGAKNARGVDLPLGKGLKRKLLIDFLCIEDGSKDYEELMSESLSDVYTYASGKMGTAKAENFLRGIFSDCVPEDYHKIIAEYPWQRIYTLNIDDLMEAAATPGLLNPVNSKTIQRKFDARSIDYVKLHGCVRNYSEGFVFSKPDYTSATTNGLDHRYAKLIDDLQTQDFIFLGATTDESDIDFYNARFNGSEETRNGGFFYIDPSPNIMLRHKISSSGAHLIQLTCEQFAQWLKENTKGTPTATPKRVGQANFDRYFLNISKTKEAQASIDNYGSKLYFGYDPTWLDIFTDWDFRKPVADRILADIDSITNSHKNAVISLISKAIGGKSVLLKRIGNSLLDKGYEVREFVGNNFNPSNFSQYASRLSSDVIVLLIDNASSLYNGIAYLTESFPKNKRLIVVATARPYYHFKKHYELKRLPGYRAYDLDLVSGDDNIKIAESAVSTLDSKLMLGKLKGKDRSEQLKHFTKAQDIAEALWNLTNGDNFRRKLLESYDHVAKRLVSPEKPEFADENTALIEILRALAIFNFADLPYMPNTLLTLWQPKAYRHIDKLLVDLTKPMVPDGRALRTDILVQHIINKTPVDDRSNIIKGILIQVAPLLRNPESYWNVIQARLMNVRFLEHQLGLNLNQIKEILYKIGKYYRHDPHYYIQLGIIEQRLNDYPRALNHLLQAQALSKDSYNIRNAIARNYLRYASRGTGIDATTAETNYAIGRQQMLELIYEKEYFQVRAYSVHSLVGETVDYWRRFKITPSKDDIKELVDCLDIVLEKAPDDPKIANTCQKLGRFIKDNKLSAKLPNFNIENLQLLKAILGDKDTQTYLEDDTLD